jgi:hypothetical protein
MSIIHANKILLRVFYNMNDTLINIIELREQFLKDPDNKLVQASIQQKIGLLDQIDFNDGVTIKSVYFLIPYFSGIVILFISIFLLSPNVYTKSTNRILHFDQYFEREYDFNIIYNNEYFVVRNGDLNFNLKLQGYNFPKEFFITVGGNDMLMNYVNDSIFSYSFRNINNSFSFYLRADNYVSNSIQVNIIDIPTIENFSVNLTYPKYIGKKNETLEGIYDFSVPQGTDIEIFIKSNYTDSIFINSDSFKSKLFKNDDNFTFDTTLFKLFIYSMNFINSDKDSLLLVNKKISVVSDLFPEIMFDSVIDENFVDIVHFKISIQDDYGFTSLFFHVENDSLPIIFNPGLQKQDTYFSHDFSNYNDSTISYYFSVYDNDVLNGYKNSRTDYFLHEKENFESFIKNEKIRRKELENKLDESISLAETLKDELNNLQQSLLNDDLEQWEKIEKINAIEEKQKELEQLLSELTKMNEKSDKQLNVNNDLSEEIKRKHEELTNNLENILSDELKELLDKLKKLSEEYNKDGVQDLSKQLENNYEELSKELDKNLEKLKKYEIQKNVELLAEELYQLSNDEIVNIDTNYTSEKAFEFIKQEYDSLFSINETFETPIKMKSFEEEFLELKESYKTPSKLSKKERSKKLEELGNKMKDMLNQSNSEQEGENADNLRLLLDNLFYFSFEQENLIEEYKYINHSNPKYIDIKRTQLSLQNDFSIIKDSLFELSRRSDFVGQSISDNTRNIDSNLKVVLDNLEDNKKSLVLTHQQLILTNTNELILLLSESLKNMDNASGSGSGKESKRKQKPKKGEPSLSDLRKSQEAMKAELEKMLKQMESGQKIGTKPGTQQMGEMLMRQEMFQKQLNDILGKDGISDDLSKKLNDIKRLSDENKSDIVNLKLSNDFYFRQQQILTRLLEAENAEMEREKDVKRKSEENNQVHLRESKKYFEQYNEKTNFNEIIKLDEIQLNQFYKELFNGYVNRVNAN